jgi:hypothetical protein
VGKFNNFKLKRLMFITLFVGSALAFFHIIIANSGRSSSDFFDYLNRRLSGHTKLEAVFNPLINVMRYYTGDLARKEREGIYKEALKQRYRPRDIKFDSNPVIVTATTGVYSYKTIAEAAKLAPSGAIVEIMGGNYQDAQAVWVQDEITIKALGGMVHLYAEGKSVEGKAIWVMRTKQATIEGIAFYDTHVHDKNGAGMRLETGTFNIQRCHFENNENGILTTASVSTLNIKESVFIQNGYGDGYSHGVYAGSIEKLAVKDSEFYSTYVGHHIKSRAAVSRIENVKLFDYQGLVSYELDFPNGGDVIVSGSYIEQARDNENSVILSYGVEGLKHPTNTLKVSGNTFKNFANGGTFVRTVFGTDLVDVKNNYFYGNGIKLIKINSNTNLPSRP